MIDIIDSTNLGRLVSDIKAKADNSYWPKDQTTEVDLATVATTGSYNDLTDKPTAAGCALIYLGTCDTAASTAEKTVTVTTFPTQNGKPVVGTVIGVLYSNTNSATSVTLNVNSTGAESIYYTNAVYTSSSGVICGNKNRYVFYVWNGTYWVWVSQGTDADTNTVGYSIRTNTARKTLTDNCYRYRILFSSTDGTQWVPANTSSSTNATSSRAVNQRKIDPFGPIIYYGFTTVLSAGGQPSASYQYEQYAGISIGYSFNTTGAAATMTTNYPVYIKCAPQADGSAIMDFTTPYVQALPSTNDGKIYILLGVATSETVFEMTLDHPVYYHDGSGIRVWIGLTPYVKPATGIPAADIASGVIPDAVEANATVPAGTTPTDLQNLKIGNNYYGIPTPSSSLDDLSDVDTGTPSDGDVLTYDSTTGKWVADAPSGGELSTDVVTDKTSNVKASTPKSVYDFVKPQSQSSIPAGGLQPGILYNLSVLTGSVTIDLASPADANVANEYAFTFTAGSTAPSITWPSGLLGWAGNCIDSNGVPEISAGMFYEVSILNGIGLIAEVEV